METQQIFRLSKKELTIKKIFHLEGTGFLLSHMTIINPFGLKIYEKGKDFFISANELTLLLVDTNYGIDEIACFMNQNEPLFDKRNNIYDILLDIYSFSNSISEMSNSKKYEYLNVKLSNRPLIIKTNYNE